MATLQELNDRFWGVVTVLLFTGALINGGNTFYTLDRDLDSLLDRAQVAAHAADMRHYVEAMEANMRTHDATTGHMAFVFKTPRTDLALQHQGVLRVIDRLKELERLPHASEAYQSGLDDLRGVLRETSRMAWGVFAAKQLFGLRGISRPPNSPR